MKIRDFIKEAIDIDIIDDCGDSFGVAFVGPLSLTPSGEKQFAAVLDCEISIEHDIKVAVVAIGDGRGWLRKWRDVSTFFYAAAGYCSLSDYGRWFEC